MKTTSSQLEGLYKTNPLKACRSALRLTRTVPVRERLEAIDKLLGTYGTKGIRGDWQNGFWCDIVAAYCNTGDTYALTVLDIRTDFGGHKFIISSWGDFVERNEKRLGII